MNTVCTAEQQPTSLSSHSKQTSHMNICISSSHNGLSDVAVNIFFISSTCTIDIYRHIYLHSIFLQSIEKINSIAFIVTLCISGANVHVLPFVAFCLQPKRLSRLRSSCPRLSLQLSSLNARPPEPLFSCCEHRLLWQGRKGDAL